MKEENKSKNIKERVNNSNQLKPALFHEGTNLVVLH